MEGTLTNMSTRYGYESCTQLCKINADNAGNARTHVASCVSRLNRQSGNTSVVVSGSSRRIRSRITCKPDFDRSRCIDSVYAYYVVD